MGERKGQNKYYPPDYDPRKGSLNAFLGTHALRERAKKIHLGIIVIRFEMPYHIWCEGCGNHVARGVRYNAEKKKVGNYYTTPIFEFRMKCHLCDNYYVIRTDPKNFDYEIISGCRRKETRWEPSKNDDAEVITDKETAVKLVGDAMFKLEHVEHDLNKAKEVAPRLAKLEAIQGRLKDDFSQNQMLRKLFRVKKTELKAQAVSDNALLAKSSLDIKLLPESDEDRELASLMAQYRTVSSFNEVQKNKRQMIQERPIFATTVARRRTDINVTNESCSSATGGDAVLTSKDSRKRGQSDATRRAFKKRLTRAWYEQRAERALQSGQASTNSSSSSSSNGQVSRKSDTFVRVKTEPIVGDIEKAEPVVGDIEKADPDKCSQTCSQLPSLVSAAYASDCSDPESP